MSRARNSRNCLALETSENVPYAARCQGEANLHMVLHKAIDLLSGRLKAIVPEFAPSILVPSRVKSSRYYSRRIWNEDRLYFKRRLERPSLAQHAHQHRGFLRAPAGDVQDHDEVTHRGLAYCFDRSAASGNQRIKEMLRNYCMDPRAARRNVHSHKEWIDVTSTHEQYATTGRIAAMKNRKIERSFRIQGAWSKAQEISMENQRGTCTHLLSLITRELQAEAKREFFGVNKLSTDSKQTRLDMVRHEKARCEAADRIMRVIAEYGAMTSAQEADYLRYTVETAHRHYSEYTRATAHSSIGLMARVTTSAITLGSTECVLEQQSDSEAAICEAHNDVCSTTQESRRTQRAASHEADCSFTASQLRCITTLGGKLRKGLYADNVTITPASIPMPKAYFSGGLSNPRSSTLGEFTYAKLWSSKFEISKCMEKSAYARSAFDSARAHSDWSTAVIDRDIHLWSRMSEHRSAHGERCYSETFGQPMKNFSAAAG